MALTKAELYDNLIASFEISKHDAKHFVEHLFDSLRSSLEEGESVKVSGFGNFDLRDKEERPGRNPRTGKNVPIEARRVVTFKPGQKLRARVEHYKKGK